ncbi:uncharacterized protein YodC (DUF2158 family) [Paraburkholderia sp. MM5496-R1]|uniref:DUF2158 domain-containing protein n=1 Tax=Paraburkholderia sp. MM5496-R1 TaxID=2991065 RepID=UPI003D1CB7CC
MQIDALRTQFVGKTVWLKSGGTPMTVEQVIETPDGFKLDCCWVDRPGSKKMERARLNLESVELASRAPMRIKFF